MLFGIARASQRAAGFVRGRSRAPLPGEWLARDEAIMGTAIRVELWSEDRAGGEAAIDAVMAEMHRIDRAMSPYKPGSELSRINRDAAAGPVPVSAEMYALLERAQHFAALSDGAFDITYASVGHLYDYRERIRPSDAAVEQARAGDRPAAPDPGGGHAQRALRPQRHAHRPGRLREGTRGRQRAAAILTRRGVRNAIVSAGGDSRVLGDRRGRPWTIAMRDPRRAGEVVALLPLEDVAISTSGDYERYFEQRRGALTTTSSIRRRAVRPPPCTA